MNTPQVYLYNTNLIISLGLPLLMVASFFKPKYFAAFVIAMIMLRPNERFALPFSYPEVLFFLLLFSITLNIHTFKEFKYSKDYYVIALYVLFIMLITILFHRENYYGILLKCGFGLLIYYYVTVVLISSKALKLFALTFLISSFLICFEPFYYRITEPVYSPIWFLFNTLNNRIMAWGMWENSNETSFIANIGTISALFLLSLKKRVTFTSVVVYGSIISFFFYIVCLTSSRTGLGCFLLIFMGMVFCIKSNLTKTVISIIIVGIMITAPMLTPQRDELEKAASTSERADLRYIGVHLFMEYPLTGVGFDRAQNDAGGMVLHNTFVQAFAETGIIGGMLFLYYIWIILRVTYKKWRLFQKEPIFSISNLLPGVFLCMILYIFFGNQLLTPMFLCAMALIKTALDTIGHDKTMETVAM